MFDFGSYDLVLFGVGEENFVDEPDFLLVVSVELLHVGAVLLPGLFVTLSVGSP